MERVYFATGNQGKVDEMRPKFEEKGLELEQIEVDIEEIDALDVEKVAEQKAKDSLREVLEQGRMPEVLIVEDTGFYIEALNGFPGAKAAFFDRTCGADKLLKLMEDEENRAAYFKTVIAAVVENEVHLFTGEIHGEVPEEKRGESHEYLPYDSYFVPEGHDKSFAEDNDHKQKVSQREKALRKFLEWV